MRPLTSFRELPLPIDGDSLGLHQTHAPNGCLPHVIGPLRGPSSYHGLWPWLVILLGLVIVRGLLVPRPQILLEHCLLRRANSDLPRLVQGTGPARRFSAPPGSGSARLACCPTGGSSPGPTSPSPGRPIFGVRDLADPRSSPTAATVLWAPVRSPGLLHSGPAWNYQTQRPSPAGSNRSA
jgi:hypothetical protein